MDRAIYVAMLGAKQTLTSQAVNSHNLANASTTGFKADLAQFSAKSIDGPGYASRVNVLLESGGWSSNGGSISTTGRDLDVAVQGEGWIAVQGPSGEEAYTRAGDLNVTAQGLLETSAGHLVLGETGPVSMPPNAKLSIGADGTISMVPEGQNPDTIVRVDRIKLVDSPEAGMTKGRDGLFYSPDESVLEASSKVRLQSGALEASNVNPADALVSMIELSRQFEMQIRTMSAAERNAETATRMIRS